MSMSLTGSRFSSESAPRPWYGVFFVKELARAAKLEDANAKTSFSAVCERDNIATAAPKGTDLKSVVNNLFTPRQSKRKTR
jgi:hypothetical protein